MNGKTFAHRGGQQNKPVGFGVACTVGGRPRFFGNPVGLASAWFPRGRPRSFGTSPDKWETTDANKNIDIMHHAIEKELETRPAPTGCVRHLNVAGCYCKSAVWI